MTKYMRQGIGQTGCTTRANKEYPTWDFYGHSMPTVNVSVAIHLCSQVAGNRHAPTVTIRRVASTAAQYAVCTVAYLLNRPTSALKTLRGGDPLVVWKLQPLSGVVCLSRQGVKTATKKAASHVAGHLSWLGICLPVLSSPCWMGKASTVAVAITLL